jgi:ABC-type maltose transport system permease subunit
MVGATTWRIFWRIYLPMSGSALAAVLVLQATFVSNDVLLGLTLTQSAETRPVMTALSAMQSTYGGSTMPTALAGRLIVSIPTMALFLITQRFHPGPVARPVLTAPVPAPGGRPCPPVPSPPSRTWPAPSSSTTSTT